jgi:hypothetical protein
VRGIVPVVRTVGSEGICAPAITGSRKATEMRDEFRNLPSPRARLRDFI